MRTRASNGSLANRPPSPDVSVIVPLYGRCDFLRYQLAHFADDPDFARVDLIYVSTIRGSSTRH